MKGNNNVLMTWADSNGATSLSLNKKLLEVALANGATSLELNTALNQMLIAKGYAGAFNTMWTAFVEDGMVLSEPGVYNSTFTVEANAASYRANIASLSPSNVEWTDNDEWVRLEVDASDVLQFEGNGAGSMHDHSKVLVNFPGMDSTDYELRLLQASGYEIHQGTIPGLSAYMASENGNSIDMRVTVYGDLSELGTNEHWFIPEQVSPVVRGINISVIPGTYNPGYLARCSFTETVSTFILNIRVATSGAVFLDCPQTPNITSPGPSIEFEGYNWDAPIQLGNWNGQYFVVVHDSALYTYLGTILGTRIKIRVIGPGV